MESLRPFRHDVPAETTTQKTHVNRMTAAFAVMALAACSPKGPFSNSSLPEFQRVDEDKPALTFPFPSGQFWAATRLYNDSSHMDYGGDLTDDRWAMDFAQSGCDAYGELVTPIADGVVHDVVDELSGGGYGNTILVAHEDDFFSRYAHLSLNMVSVGDEVSTSTPLGKVGDTGYTLGTSCKDENDDWHTGVHLHVALYKDGEGIVPEPISGESDLEEGCWYNREGDKENCGEGQPADYPPEAEVNESQLSIEFFDVSPSSEGVGTQNETDFVWVATVDSEEKPDDVTLYIQNPEDPAWSTEMETFSKEKPWVYTFRKYPVKYGDYTAWVKATNDFGTIYSNTKISPVNAPNYTTLEIRDVEVDPETGTEDSTEFTWSAELIAGTEPEAWLNIVNPHQPIINRFPMDVEEAGEGTWTARFDKTLMDATVYSYWIEADNGSRRDTSLVHSVETEPALGWGGYGEDLDCDVTVPTDHLFIQHAIDAAKEGDTICVAAGTYYENLVMDGRTLNLKSLDGADLTILDGTGLGPVLEIKNASNGLIDGFTIQNGFDPFGGGISINGSSPNIQHCRIVDNDFYGIGIMDNSLPVIQNSVIANNDKRGVYVSNWSEPEFNNVVIAENGTAGLSSDVYSHVTLSNSMVVDNWDEGVAADSTSTVTDSYNNVYGNVLGNYEEGTAPGVGSTSNAADFVDRTWYRLDNGSQGIDDGNPSAALNDFNGSRNDMGAYGGPLGNW